MKTIVAGLLAAAALFGTAAQSATVDRIVSPGPDGKPGLILKGVIVPAGSETFYLSGQLADPIDPAKKETMADFGDTKTQTVSVLTKIKALLASKGYTMGDVVKMQAFLAADPKLGKIDFMGFNAGFKEFFGSTDNPNTVARSTFQVANLVAPTFLVELEVTAVKAPK
ncbi:Enamine deaminase RidA, house cleaning of reactive enamine intermediates, YjgF/YER057c/UK114 family [Sphingomonas sp. YR710]|jgi:enamine deaminase RidA (YjgF/YER057c/UK114 family)|uniref:RidA family protein n=1 Tax=Sphingomonas sp. YR710 TaxID=1882773 RepID=UPI00088AD083|nr:RidA family protein [Sphingomonas sp. YR710]SDC74824.1 Enamine deaminase RidA, house cleaning of reactive enamine intermediates, YjgF/YER057c/UK114 family [Sphingomonas sp. YR710]